MLELLLTTLSDQKGTTNMTDYLLLLSPNEVASLYPMFLQSKYSFVNPTKKSHKKIILKLKSYHNEQGLV